LLEGGRNFAVAGIGVDDDDDDDDAGGGGCCWGDGAGTGAGKGGRNGTSRGAGGAPGTVMAITMNADQTAFDPATAARLTTAFCDRLEQLLSAPG